MQRRNFMQTLSMTGLMRYGSPRPTAAQTTSGMAALAPPDPDYVVTNETELVAAFANLQDGECIYITADGAPYEISDYLDVDASDVLIGGHGPRPLIRCADGGNTGFMRIGFNEHVERVTVSGLSYDGNPEGQTLTEGGFGIASYDANNVTIEGCDIRRTVPYHEHNNHNSGIAIYGGTTNFVVRNNHFEDIGDRAIETGANAGVIAFNTSKNGFDRMVSCDLGIDDSDFSGAPATDSLLIIGNHLDHNAEGSMIGLGNSSRTPSEVIIMGNTARGGYRRFCRVASLRHETRVDIAHNIAIGPSPSEAVEVWTDNVSVTGNYLTDHRRGVTVQAPTTVVQGNRIENNRQYGIWVKDDARGRTPDHAGRGGGRRSVVQHNVLQYNGSAGRRFAEIRTDDTRVRVVNNNITGLRRGRACFDNPRGWGSVFAWNVTPIGAKLFDRKHRSTTTLSNLN